jgi:hypothetical protein
MMRESAFASKHHKSYSSSDDDLEYGTSNDASSTDYLFSKKSETFTQAVLHDLKNKKYDRIKKGCLVASLLFCILLFMTMMIIGIVYFFNHK